MKIVVTAFSQGKRRYISIWYFKALSLLLFRNIFIILGVVSLLNSDQFTWWSLPVVALNWKKAWLLCWYPSCIDLFLLYSPNKKARHPKIQYTKSKESQEPGVFSYHLRGGVILRDSTKPGLFLLCILAVSLVWAIGCLDQPDQWFPNSLARNVGS